MSDRVREFLRRLDSWLLGILVVLGALTLTGCATVPAPSGGVADEVFSVVLRALVLSRGLRFGIGKKLPQLEEDKHKAFFILRRVRALAQGRTLNQLIARIEQDYDEVDSFVTLRFSGPNSLEKAAPDGASDAALTDPFTCRPERHLDLDNLSNFRKPPSGGESLASFTKTKKEDFEKSMKLRQEAARAIIWRAAGIHPGADVPPTPTDPGLRGLWDEKSTVAFPNRLRQEPLKEILNRRLRLVERMNSQVNTRAFSPFTRTPGILPRGPWFDLSRVRNVNYPFFDQRTVGDLVPVDSKGDSTDPLWIAEGRRITYDAPEPDPSDPTKTRRHIPTRISPEPGPVGASTPTLNPTWLSDPAGGNAYERKFVPQAALPGGGTGPDLADAVDALVLAKENIWDRPWLYCDHVCLTLHLEALRFALLRRVGQPDPKGTFDAIGSKNAPSPGGFVWLGGALGAAPDPAGAPSTWTGPDKGRLFQGGDADVWFENNFIRPEDLQVGDQVIYYNNIVYNVFVNDAFRLENAIVSGLESDANPKNHGSIVVAGTRLAGHGLPFTSIQGYGKTMAEGTQGGLAGQRTKLEKPADPGTSFINRYGFLFIRWDPPPYPGIIVGKRKLYFVWLPRTFPDIRDPGALPYKERWRTPQDMLAAIPHTLLDPPQAERGSGYNEFPKSVTVTIPGLIPGTTTTKTFALTDGVLFPLYLPFVVGERLMEWPEYFARKKDDPSLEVRLFEFDISYTAREINNVIHMSGDIPGLFIAGTEQLPIQVLRPKVRV